MDSDLLTEEQIKYIQDHLDEFPIEFFDKLREKDKHLVFDILNWQPDDKGEIQGKHVVSDRAKKRKPNVHLDLPPIIKEEIKRCQQDIIYFRDNYVKILTKKGVDFPEPRPYNERILKQYTDKSKDETVVLAGRQCVGPNTIIDTNLGAVTIKQLFDEMRYG